MKNLVILTILAALVNSMSNAYPEFSPSREQDKQVAEMLVSIMRTSYQASKKDNSSYEQHLQDALDEKALELEEILHKHSVEDLKYTLGQLAVGSGVVLALISLFSKLSDRARFVWLITSGGLSMLGLAGVLGYRANWEDFLERKTYNLYEEQFATLRRFSLLLKNMIDTPEWTEFKAEISS